MSRGRANKLVGSVGEYLVCAELGRRGLIATPFSGNVPAFDVLATDEQCRTVPIQVKTSTSRTWKSDARAWMRLEYNPKTQAQRELGLLEIEYPDLIYVCVALATSADRRDRFFVLTKSDLQRVCVEHYRRYMEPRDWKRPREPRSFDLRYRTEDLAAFEDNWQLIFTRLEPHRPPQRMS